MQQTNPASAMARSTTGRDGTSGPMRKSSAADSVAGGAITTDICVIGAGSGGLAVAEAAAAFGRSVVLVEKHKMGGDCLNFGCVPSKALLAAAKRAYAMRTAGAFGITAVEPHIDPRAVNHHIKSVIATLAPNNAVERFSGLGVRVILGAGRFLDKRTLLAGDYRITARRFVIATGSSPLVPPIAGLDQAPYFTNESIFDNDKKIGHLIVIGGGPIGMEMAQAHARLGARVTVLEGARALGNDDPELTAVVLRRLRAEGVDIREGAMVERVETMPGYIRVHVGGTPIADTVDGTHLLVAAGRRPNTAELNLDAAGVKATKRGISVSVGLKTTNGRIYAIGDVVGGPQFTHTANYQARIFMKRALFWLPAKMKPDIVPWVTFTDPELAQVGLTEHQAAQSHTSINVLRWPYHENDRAHAERQTEGHIKIVTSKKGRVLGAGIAGANAGDLIQPWCLAVSEGLHISAMTAYVTPYPTFGEISTRAALRYFVKTPSSPFVRKVINLVAKLG